VADTLKRLLEVERQAEAIVESANEAREKLVHQAVAEARLAEQRFEARIGEIRTSFLQKSTVRAEQTIAEMQRRFDEREKQLQDVADQHREEALHAALALLLDPERE